MRYHWGLGVGHTYAHQGNQCNHPDIISGSNNNSQSGGNIATETTVDDAVSTHTMLTLSGHESPPPFDDVLNVDEDNNGDGEHDRDSDGDYGDSNSVDSISGDDDEGSDEGSSGSEEEGMEEMYGQGWGM